jgi:hypothetical protein
VQLEENARIVYALSSAVPMAILSSLWDVEPTGLRLRMCITLAMVH